MVGNQASNNNERLDAEVKDVPLADRCLSSPPLERQLCWETYGRLGFVPAVRGAKLGNRKGVGMPSGRDMNIGKRGTGGNKRNAFCSFCRKSYRDVGPLVEGQGDG